MAVSAVLNNPASVQARSVSADAQDTPDSPFSQYLASLGHGLGVQDEAAAVPETSGAVPAPEPAAKQELEKPTEDQGPSDEADPAPVEEPERKDSAPAGAKPKEKKAPAKSEPAPREALVDVAKIAAEELTKPGQKIGLPHAQIQALPQELPAAEESSAEAKPIEAHGKPAAHRQAAPRAEELGKPAARGSDAQPAAEPNKKSDAPQQAAGAQKTAERHREQHTDTKAQSDPTQAATPTSAPQAPGAQPKAGATPAIGDKSVRPAGAIGGSPSISAKDALRRLTAQAPALKRTVEQQSFVAQAAKGLAAALKQGEGTITLRLQPGNLGQLKVQLTLHEASVAAKIEPTTESARQLLLDSEHSLRAALEARGLSVERIDVASPPPHAAEGPGTPEATMARDGGVNADSSGGEHAQRGHPGDGAEAHTGGGDTPEEPALGSVTYVLERGVYRLDAVA